jgi:hypothetical protein
VRPQLQQDDVAQYRDLLERMRRLEQGALSAEIRVPLVMSAGWEAYGGEFAGGAVYSREGGFVLLQGTVTKTTGLPTANDVIATIPYAPSERLPFDVAVGETFGAGRVDVLNNGQVVWITGSVTEPDYVSLATVAFAVA